MRRNILLEPRRLIPRKLLDIRHSHLIHILRIELLGIRFTLMLNHTPRDSLRIPLLHGIGHDLLDTRVANLDILGAWAILEHDIPGFVCGYQLRAKEVDDFLG